jgi:ABC-type lipoprotein export system ATPase subunit
MTDPVLQVRGLRHRVTLPDRRTLEILRSVDLTVMPGESIAIVGRSGSGKTTLLAALGLLTPVTEGELIVQGHDARRMNDRQRSVLRNRSIGFVFQSYSLVRHLSARRNVDLPQTYGSHVGLRDRRRRVREVLELVRLQDRAHSRPRQLSGGEQQRVAIARALIRSPQILLADEPTGALDVDTATHVLGVLVQATQDTGCALIVVTHDPQVAAEMSRTLSLVDGRLHPAHDDRRPVLTQPAETS